MLHRSRPTPSRRGMALLVSLVIVTLVTGLGAAYLRIHMSNTARQDADTDRWRAFYVAEAALAEAFLAVAQGRSGNVGSQEQPAFYGDGVCWVESTTEPNGRVSLRATAQVGRGRASLGLLLERSLNPLGELGFFGEEAVVLEPDVQVSGTDSSNPLLGGPMARVGSNGDIEVRAGRGLPTTLDGQALPGPDGVVVIDPGASVSGAVLPRSETMRLPAVPVPDLALDPARVHADLRSPLVLGGGDAGYSSLTVASGTEVVLQGPLRLVVGNLLVEPSATVTVDSSAGPVAVYVDGSLDLRSGSVLADVAGDPSSVLWMVSGDPADETGGVAGFEPTGSFVGQLYAPDAKLRVPSTLRVTGSVVARSLTLGSGSRAVFDAQVTRAALGTHAMPEQLGWRVVEFPEGTIFGDALFRYRMQGVDPTPLDEAQRERTVTLTYLDATGVVQSFSGELASLDPSLVAATVDLSWEDPDTGLPLADRGLQGLPNVPTVTSTETKASQREEDKLEAYSAELRDRLLLATPATDGQLLGALRLDPPMLSQDLLDVLEANSPLSTTVWDEANLCGVLDAAELRALSLLQ